MRTVTASAAAAATPGPQAIIDTVPGDTSTTATLTVDAAVTVSAIDTIGDQDFYKVELVAGHDYEIGMYGYTPQNIGDPIGPNGLPLLDAYLELYDSAGNLITAADGGADTVLNTANSGFDAALIFTPTTSGTYYVNARAFDNVPDDGTDGDMIGDYGIYVEDATGDPSIYHAYYDPSSPLYAIDWGTQVDGTVRNPDGAETGHITGNAQSTPDNPFGYDVAGKNVITIYFAKPGDVFVSNDLTNPGLPPATVTATGVQDFERTAVLTALAEFAKVADVTYVEVQDRDEANFIYTSYIGTPGPGVSLLGSMSPPQESDEGLAQFNSGDYRWNATDLQQGGFSFVTLIHEFGHGHGLAHPHDNGGHSGIMNGVESDGPVADYTTGDYELNQGVFTMMSYEDGWQSSPYGNAETDVGYGYLGGLMAFDIAAIQDKYGVNENWATGNDTYTLKDVNAAGTYYTSIWDAGGTDSMVYAGARNATIDLRAATLQYETGGGGNVSYAYGIFGGFTIANGVVIENASTGSGTDTLIGNDAANQLNGGAGADAMTGGLGDDVYYVDNRNDVIVELPGGGYDKVRSTTYQYTLSANIEELIGNLASGQRLTGNAGDNTIRGDVGNDVIVGDAGNDVLIGGVGADRMTGGTGDDTYYVDNAGDVVVEGGSGGTDRVLATASATLSEHVENLTLMGTAVIDGTGNSAANRLVGNDMANQLWGMDGADTINGGGGNDRIHGGLGQDTLDGGAGADFFYFDTVLGGQPADIILNYSVADDTIYLDRDVFTALKTNGTLAETAFRAGTAAADADDRIIYDSATGNIWYDSDGMGGAAQQLVASVSAGTLLTGADFYVGF